MTDQPSDETCVACGASPTARFSPSTGEPASAVHPWVAVLQATDLPEGRVAVHDGSSARGRAFASAPVCDACHRDPSRHSGLKAHFFPRAVARVATLLAGADGDVVAL